LARFWKRPTVWRLAYAYQLLLLTERSRKELYLPAKAATSSDSRPTSGEAVVCWSVKPVGKPDAGNPHVRFDEGECGNGARLKYCDTRRRKGELTGNTNLNLNHRVTSLLYQSARFPLEPVWPGNLASPTAIRSAPPIAVGELPFPAAVCHTAAR